MNDRLAELKKGAPPPPQVAIDVTESQTGIYIIILLHKAYHLLF